MECGICFESYNNSSKKVYTHNYCFYQGEHKNLNKGNQPEGKMTWRILNESLPGFRYFKTIEISYYFPSGTQKSNHPNPGKSKG